MCIWKVRRADRLCEFCLWGGPCECRGPEVVDRGDVYLEAMTGVLGKDVLGRDRGRIAVWSRYMVMYMMRKDGLSWKVIGRRVGKDHSTVIYAVRQVEKMLELPKMYRQEYKVWKSFQKKINLLLKKEEKCSKD